VRALAGPGPNDGDRAEASATPWLGVRLQSITPELASALHLDDERGALVSEVRAQSPAGRAGIEQGDVVVGFGGRAIETPRDLQTIVSRYAPGEQVDVELIRKGKPVTVKTRLAPRPDGAEPEADDSWMPRLPHAVWNRAQLGVRAEEMNDDLAAYFGTGGGRGVLVLRVDEGSPAERAGVKAGDVILKAGGEPITSMLELRRRVREAGEDAGLSLLILRQRREIDVDVTFDERPRGEAPSHERWFDSLNGSVRGFMGRFDRERLENEATLRKEMEKLTGELAAMRSELDQLRKKLAER
jgi:S1-C subfamily serine protease